MALATFDQLKGVLDLSKATISDYPYLELLNDSMQSTFESYCVREFDLKERTATFIVSDENGEQDLWLKGLPLSAISAITIDGSGLDIDNDLSFSDDGHILLSTPVERGGKIIVTYTGGIIDQTSESTLLATIPKDINLAAVRQICFEYQNRDKIAVKSISLDGNVTTIPETNLLAYTKRILDNYKNYGAGF